MVKDPIEHGSGKNAVSGEGTIPTAESEIRGEIIEPHP
jgi:hypothetical protein